MSVQADLIAWCDQLVQLLVDIAHLTGALGVYHRPQDEPIETASDREVRAALRRITAQVQAANAAAERLHAADPTLADVVRPLLGVPGEAPEVDLRPWWSRLLDRVSSRARRATLAEALETLRLEADAALLRAAPRRARA